MLNLKQEQAKALEILQGKIDGDIYEAAGVVGARMLVEMNRDQMDGLTDWLTEGDYDGSETINSLVREWIEIAGEELTQEQSDIVERTGNTSWFDVVDWLGDKTVEEIEEAFEYCWAGEPDNDVFAQHVYHVIELHS